MAQAQIQDGQFTALNWSDHDSPWLRNDLMKRTENGLLLNRPFETDGLVRIRFYVELRDEFPGMFAYLDQVLWLSPPVPGLTVKPFATHDEESVESSRNLSFLPSRLIDVGGSEESCVRLLSNTDGVRNKQYVTLSYCWGGAQRLKLESSNAVDLERGFLFEDLPQTIREAGEVTREIGIRYLWVDSVCIVQDSFEDWESEAVRMSDVYRSSYCTTMAMHGRDSDEGLFRPRVDTAVWPTWHEV
ncbi:hypothetical protein diail_3063 [Diaporthe ilicicola]|nr:hypothetical protein diail_3063 [Diaporthe ilicicola]